MMSEFLENLRPEGRFLEMLESLNTDPLDDRTLVEGH